MALPIPRLQQLEAEARVRLADAHDDVARVLVSPAYDPQAYRDRMVRLTTASELWATARIRLTAEMKRAEQKPPAVNDASVVYDPPTGDAA